MHRFRRQLMALLLVTGMLYLALCALAFAAQRSLIYPAPRSSPEALRARPGFGTVPLATGLQVDRFYLPAPPGAPTVVHFHGNGEQLLGQQGMGQMLGDAGLGFLAVEYPGYGASPGSPSEAGLYASAEAALQLLRDEGVKPEDIVLSGRSLGTGVAVEMARRGYGARMVLVSPYTSMVAMGQRTVPFLPATLLMRDRYQSQDKAPGIPIPVLIIHGEDDDVVPVAMGRELGQRFPHATVVTVPGAGHNDVLEQDGQKEFARLATFALEGG
ncbi:alpha/beta hydrolase [Corallococcus sp. Z5C101001]|uniref:alpha/beta hydrolase n=1 Tax=Corallococcus sp. Z5C101001 TaxID=2596829 RepID=UPI002104C222|nr:alpha/beta hydrolase [Corallococcus sp. Z5C101001]